MYRAGLRNDGEITAETARPIQQERGKRVRQVRLRRRVRGRSRLAPAEVEDTAGTALILGLKQVVPVMSIIAAGLDRVSAPEFGHRRRDIDGCLPAIPRQRRGEAGNRIG